MLAYMFGVKSGHTWVYMWGKVGNRYRCICVLKGGIYVDVYVG